MNCEVNFECHEWGREWESDHIDASEIVLMLAGQYNVPFSAVCKKCGYIKEEALIPPIERLSASVSKYYQPHMIKFLQAVNISKS